MQKARNTTAPRAAGPPHVSAYLRIKETRALKGAVGDLLGTDRCALQLIAFPCQVKAQVKGPVGREDTSESHILSPSVAQHDTICTEVRPLIHVTVCVNFPTQHKTHKPQ
jgi:hypothetical protein